MYKYLLLLLPFFAMAKTIEQSHMPLSVGDFEYSVNAGIDIMPNSYIHLRLTGVDLSYYPEFTLTASDFIYITDDEIVFQTHDDVIIPSVTPLVIKGKNVNVNGDVDFGLVKINNSKFDFVERKITAINSLRFSAGNGGVTLVSDADYYLGGYHEVSFDISDRDSYKGTALINSPITFEALIDEKHTDYVVTISNAFQRGVPALIDSDLLFNIESSYKTYSVGYGYGFESNSSWYTFYKLQNIGTKDSRLIVTAYLSSAGVGESDIEKCEFEYGALGKNVSLNLTGNDLIEKCGLSGDYHIAVKFHSEQELFVSSQNASPNGRTVNLVK